MSQLHGMERHFTTHYSADEVLQSKEYSIPKWLKGIECPFTCGKVFKGRYGFVNYEDVGPKDGQVIFAFHGLNGTRLTFSEIQAALPKKGSFRIISFDLYGHGMSSAPKLRLFGNRYSVDFFIEQAMEVLEVCNVPVDKKIDLLGYSMGCVIAIGFGKKYHSRIRRIALCSPAGFLEKKPFILKVAQCNPCLLPMIPHCACKCCFSRESFAGSMTETEIANGVEEKMWNRLMWQIFVKKGVVGALLGCVTRLPLFSSHEISAELGQKNIPTLILWGAKDNVCPVSSLDKVKNCFPNSTEIIFPKASHLLLSDMPWSVLKSLYSFYASEVPYENPDEWKKILPFNEKGEIQNDLKGAVIFRTGTSSASPSPNQRRNEYYGGTSSDSSPPSSLMRVVLNSVMSNEDNAISMTPVVIRSIPQQPMDEELAYLTPPGEEEAFDLDETEKERKGLERKILERRSHSKHGDSISSPSVASVGNRMGGDEESPDALLPPEHTTSADALKGSPKFKKKLSNVLYEQVEVLFMKGSSSN